jgi:arabinogalactan endo-1,4-beta-galactosidase
MVETASYRGDGASAPIGFMVLAVIVVIGMLLQVRSVTAGEFAAGADFSHLGFFESRGVVYRDAGQAQDGLAILKRHGLSCVRLRLFTSSPDQAQSDPYNYVNNLDYTLPLALRVKGAGLRFLLDLHYSDTWADPGHQTKPAAWTNLNFSQLVQGVRDYSSNCISAFRAAGAMPDYVQVGNEITSGMLWPDGHVGGTDDTPAQWSKLGQLLTAAIEGVRAASGSQVPQIMIHIDRGGDWAGTQWFFEHLNQQNVPFDLIGESYYPFWHGSLSNLASCLGNAAQRYQKPVVVVETAFPWTNRVWGGGVAGLTASPAGQVQYLAALASIVRSLPGGLGSGIFWWGTEYQRVSGVNEAGFDTASFFDSAGNVLPAVDTLGQILGPLSLSCALDGTSLKLSWPMSGAGLTLTTTTNPAPWTAWTPLANSASFDGTRFQATLPLDTQSCRLYRLQAPYPPNL